jgi:hypothetical protein
MPRVALLPAEVVIEPRFVSTASVPTTLSVWVAPCVHHQHVQFSVREEQHAAHRRLARNLIQILAARPLVERAARRLVSVTHHLHVSMEQGAVVRLRKAGTFRSTWHVDLLRNATALCSWPVEARTVEELDGLDLILQRHNRPTERSSEFAALGNHMRDIAEDLHRQHHIDELIRRNLELPTADLLKLLDERGLLGHV